MTTNNFIFEQQGSNNKSIKKMATDKAVLKELGIKIEVDVIFDHEKGRTIYKGYLIAEKTDFHQLIFEMDNFFKVNKLLDMFKSKFPVEENRIKFIIV